MRGVSIKAVALATFASLGVDIVNGLLLAALFDIPPLDAEMTQEQMQAAIAASLTNRGYVACTFILGTASTVLGGYLAARLARVTPYFNGLAFGLVGIALTWLTSIGLPTWFRTVAILLIAPAALFGAHLAKRQTRAMA